MAKEVTLNIEYDLDREKLICLVVDYDTEELLHTWTSEDIREGVVNIWTKRAYNKGYDIYNVNAPIFRMG